MMKCRWANSIYFGDGCTVHKLYNVVFQTVPRDPLKQKLVTNTTKPVSPGMFFGMAKPKPKPNKVVQPKQKEVVTPFQAMTSKHPLLQPKFGVTSMSKPDLHIRPGQFIPSDSELMSVKSKENAQELMERYLSGYEDKKQPM